MGLVENEDLVAVAGRRITGSFAKFTGVIDTVVRGCVDLDYVERTAAVASKFNT